MTHPALIERITRSLAYMLRHQPEKFDLELDSHGYAHVDEVVRALNERLGEPVELSDLETAITSGDRPRYEIRGERVRALYGHSIPVEPGEPTRPPEFLYVGIDSRDAERALRYGLRGGRRRFLHLALTPEDAREAGRRAAPDYSVLNVYALDAWEEGINFYDRQALFLAEEVPTQFLELAQSFTDGYELVGRPSAPAGFGRGREERRGGGRGGAERRPARTERTERIATPWEEEQPAREESPRDLEELEELPSTGERTGGEGGGRRPRRRRGRGRGRAEGPREPRREAEGELAAGEEPELEPVGEPEAPGGWSDREEPTAHWREAVPGESGGPPERAPRERGERNGGGRFERPARGREDRGLMEPRGRGPRERDRGAPGRDRGERPERARWERGGERTGERERGERGGERGRGGRGDDRGFRERREERGGERREAPRREPQRGSERPAPARPEAPRPSPAASPGPFGLGIFEEETARPAPPPAPKAPPPAPPRREPEPAREDDFPSFGAGI
jgi:putative RNA 2'-phosphotransferase